MTDLDHFVEKLGGTAKAAAAFGVGPSAVSNWKSQGHLPDRVYRRALAVADQFDVPFSEALFSKETAA